MMIKHPIDMKKIFIVYMIVSGIFMVSGIVLLYFSIIGWIVLFLASFSLIISYFELRKYVNLEKIKRDYHVNSLAEFGTTSYTRVEFKPKR